MFKSYAIFDCLIAPIGGWGIKPWVKKYSNNLVQNKGLVMK